MGPWLLWAVVAGGLLSAANQTECIASLATVPIGKDGNLTIMALDTNPVGCIAAAALLEPSPGAVPGACGSLTAAERAALSGMVVPTPLSEPNLTFACAAACAVRLDVRNLTLVHTALWGVRCLCPTTVTVAQALTAPLLRPECCDPNATEPTAVAVGDAEFVCPPLPVGDECSSPCGLLGGECCVPESAGAGIPTSIWVLLAAMGTLLVGLAELLVMKLVFALRRRRRRRREEREAHEREAALAPSDEAMMAVFTRLRPVAEAEGAAAELVAPFVRRGPRPHVVAGAWDDCPVCLEPIAPGGPEGGDVATFHCGHSFHPDCVHSYATHTVRRSRMPLCPVCQVPFASPVSHPSGGPATSATSGIVAP